MKVRSNVKAAAGDFADGGLARLKQMLDTPIDKWPKEWTE